MKLGEIDDLENQLELDFSNIERIINRLKYCATENNIDLNVNRINSNVRAAFDEVKKQIQDLRLEAIRK